MEAWWTQRGCTHQSEMEQQTYSIEAALSIRKNSLYVPTNGPPGWNSSVAGMIIIILLNYYILFISYVPTDGPPGWNSSLAGIP